MKNVEVNNTIRDNKTGEIMKVVKVMKNGVIFEARNENKIKAISLPEVQLGYYSII